MYDMYEHLAMNDYTMLSPDHLLARRIHGTVSRCDVLCPHSLTV